MVSPSCGLEYRPTTTFLAILLFIVFPFIYLTGKVVGTVLRVMFRVLLGLCRLLLCDDEDYEEQQKWRLEQQSIEEKDYVLRRRREKEKQKIIATINECVDKNEEITSLLRKRAHCNGAAQRLPSSDISESLNSECNTVEQGITPPIPLHSEHSAVANGHATVCPELDSDHQRDADDPTLA